VNGRQRILSALQGHTTDRLAWAPMIVHDYLATLPDYPTGGGAETEEAQVSFIVDFYGEIGADVITYNRPSFYRVGSGSGRVRETTFTNGDTQHTEISTPLGTLTWKRRRSDDYWFVVEPLLKEPADFRTYAYVVEDRLPEPDFTMAERYVSLIGQKGIPFPIAPAPAPKQFLMNRTIDPDHMVFCLADGNKDLIRLFDVVHRFNLGVYRIAARSPLPVFQDPGATSTGIMSPRMYEDFCMAQTREYCDILHATGKLKLDHAVGEPIKGILRQIVASGVDGIFGFRPTCEQNPTIDRIREVWGRRVCLMGGVDTDHLARHSPQQVAEETARYVEQLRATDSVVLSTSSAAMPGTTPENFRAVSRVARDIVWSET